MCKIGRGAALAGDDVGRRATQDDTGGKFDLRLVLVRVFVPIQTLGGDREGKRGNRKTLPTCRDGGFIAIGNSKKIYKYTVYNI